MTKGNQRRTKVNNFRVIYKILSHLERAMDCEEPDTDFLSAECLGISEQRRLSILEIVAKEGLAEGIDIKRSVSGDCVISLSCPRITLKGLEYLEENSMMKKAARVAKGIAEII